MKLLTKELDKPRKVKKDIRKEYSRKRRELLKRKKYDMGSTPDNIKVRSIINDMRNNKKLGTDELTNEYSNMEKN